jgi:hypothetical protein
MHHAALSQKRYFAGIDLFVMAITSNVAVVGHDFASGVLGNRGWKLYH